MPVAPPQNFIAKRERVSAFPKDHVFSLEEFKRLHPLPDNEATRASGLLDAGADAYHDKLIRRLLDNGDIAAADPSAVAMATPIGPENRTFGVVKGVGTDAEVAAKLREENAKLKAELDAAKGKPADAKSDDKKVDAKK